MNAYVLYGVNDIRYEKVEKPKPGRNEVVVRVESVGICGSDIPRIYETGAHRHPLIPGHEFAGTVCEVGENAEEYYIKSGNKSAENNIGVGKKSIVGRRVGIFPLIPCGECGPCRNKQYEMCRNYNYLGSRCDGGFAEYVKVPVWNLIELSDSVAFSDAAMLEPTSVAAHAMRRMFAEELAGSDSRDIVLKDIKETISGKNVAVIGLGTIGLLLVMHLKSVMPESCNIYVAGNKNFQQKKAGELGVDGNNYCDTTKEDVVQWFMSKTGGMGVDYIFECVGKNETISNAVEAAAPAGKVMLVGNPASDISLDKNIYWKILRNQLTLLGSWNSSYINEMDDDWHYVIDRLAAGSIKPSQLISHRLPLAELEKGLHIMRDKTEDYVKIMIKP